VSLVLRFSSKYATLIYFPSCSGLFLCRQQDRYQTTSHTSYLRDRLGIHLSRPQRDNEGSFLLPTQRELQATLTFSAFSFDSPDIIDLCTPPPDSPDPLVLEAHNLAPSNPRYIQRASFFLLFLPKSEAHTRIFLLFSFFPSALIPLAIRRFPAPRRSSSSSGVSVSRTPQPSRNRIFRRRRRRSGSSRLFVFSLRLQASNTQSLFSSSTKTSIDLALSADLRVGNLDPSVDDDDLIESFEPYGRIVRSVDTFHSFDVTYF